MKDFKLKDLDIINELDKFGSQLSATQISRNLNIPARTIRYRLNKLKEKNLLNPAFVFMHERKLGLGEEILILEENHKSQSDILSILNSSPTFYWHAHTYGKYNGFLVHSIFDQSNPDANNRIISEMEKKNLVKDHEIFQMIDYYHKSMNYKKYMPSSGWLMNWDEWFDTIDNQDVITKIKQTDLSKSSLLVDFDYKDIMLLQQLSIDGTSTLQQLGNILNLSKTQIRRRIINLKKKNIIKVVKPIFSPIPKDQMLYLYCFIETGKFKEEFINHIFQIPFSFMFIFESDNRFCIRLNISRGDMIFFINGFDLLKKYIESYFIQFIFENPNTRNPEIYELYDKDRNKWEIDIDQLILKIKKK
ncbi:MAG: winged helix-turn-helix transcriptional regulator [Candidatus Lokiarchaeota archaeon]|nr:winged helix-turn-helix transcriptional regulator [Candidatus Lokiarchaeota archaeon]